MKSAFKIAAVFKLTFSDIAVRGRGLLKDDTYLS
jgi:DNA-binding XRE family transcriptional regulator